MTDASFLIGKKCKICRRLSRSRGSRTSREGRKSRCTGRVHLRPIVSLLASMLAAYSRCKCRLASSSPMYDATYSKGSLHGGLEEHILSYIGQPKGSTTSCISIESDACLICME